MNLYYDFLPAYLQEIVNKLADVYQIDSDYALTGLFSAVAASLGDRYQIIDPKGYRNATAMWLCQIGISGYGKSECGSWLMDPLLEYDAERHEDFLQRKAEWLKALDTFFCGDADLIRYVQQIAGLAAIGKVFLEAIIRWDLYYY